MVVTIKFQYGSYYKLSLSTRLSAICHLDGCICYYSVLSCSFGQLGENKAYKINNKEQIPWCSCKPDFIQFWLGLGWGIIAKNRDSVIWFVRFSSMWKLPKCYRKDQSCILCLRNSSQLLLMWEPLLLFVGFVK